MDLCMRENPSLSFPTLYDGATFRGVKLILVRIVVEPPTISSLDIALYVWTCSE